jgi:hypothetical protein
MQGPKTSSPAIKKDPLGQRGGDLRDRSAARKVPTENLHQMPPPIVRGEGGDLRHSESAD